MTITMTKTKLALAVLVTALVIPATAFASHVFDDVPDSKFYAEPVAWAFENDITTGKSPTRFAPDDNVTRGETVTFLKRYNDNVVAPADDAIEAQVGVLQTAVAALAEESPRVSVMHYTGDSFDDTVGFGWEKVRDLGTFTKAEAGTSVLLSMTGNGEVIGTFCHWQLRVDGVTDAGNSGFGYSAADGASAVQYESGSYFTQGLFEDLPAGLQNVELWLRGSATSCENNEGNFGHDVFAIELAGG